MAIPQLTRPAAPAPPGHRICVDRRRARMRTFSGQLLKAVRERRGWTQAQLADAADIPLATIRNWEQGRAVPSIARLAQLARVLDVAMDDLMTHDPRRGVR